MATIETLEADINKLKADVKTLITNAGIETSPKTAEDSAAAKCESCAGKYELFVLLFDRNFRQALGAASKAGVGSAVEARGRLRVHGNVQHGVLLALSAGECPHA